MRWLRMVSGILALVMTLWLGSTVRSQDNSCVSTYLSGDYAAAVDECEANSGQTPEYRSAALIALAEASEGEASTAYYEEAIATLEAYIEAKQSGAASSVGAAGDWRTSTLTENLGGSLFNLAIAFDAVGNLEQAVNYYQQAATVLEQCLSLDSTDSVCQQQRELVGGFERVRKNLGIALLATGDPELALSEFQRATELNSAYGDGYYLTGVSQTQLSAYDAALGSYQQSLSPDVEFRFPERSYNGQGVAHIMQGDLTTARQDFDQSIQTSDSSYSTAFSNRGIANFDLGNLADAVTDYDRYTILRPDDAAGFMDLGYVHFSIGAEERALSVAPNLSERLAALPAARHAFYDQQIVAYAPGKRFNLASLSARDRELIAIARDALAQASSAELEKAGKAYEDALMLAPENPDALYGLATVRRSQGFSEQALDLFKAAEPRFRDLDKTNWSLFTSELDIPALEARIETPSTPEAAAPQAAAATIRDGFSFAAEPVVAAYDANQVDQLLELATAAPDALIRRDAVHGLRLKQARSAFPSLQQRLSQPSGSYLEPDQGVRASILYFLDQVPPPPPPAPKVTTPVVSRPAPPPPQPDTSVAVVASTQVAIAAPVTEQLAAPILEPPAPVVQAGCGTGDLISQAICRFRT